MNWEIHGCGGRCLLCDRDYTDGESFWCRLFMEEEGPRREDYCVECWEKKAEVSGGYSSWQGRYRAEPEKIEEEPIKEPILKHLLKKWLSSGEKLHQCFCYILTIMLERNKTFSEKPRVKSNDGTEQIVYEDRDTGETYIITDPCMSIKEFNEIEGQLREMLKCELDGNVNP